MVNRKEGTVQGKSKRAQASATFEAQEVEHVPAGVRLHLQRRRSLFHAPTQARRCCNGVFTSASVLQWGIPTSPSLQTLVLCRIGSCAKKYDAYPVVHLQEYVGTLRWSPSTVLPALPLSQHIGTLNDWSDWLRSRLEGSEFIEGNTLRIPGHDMIDGVPQDLFMKLQPIRYARANSSTVACCTCSPPYASRILADTACCRSFVSVDAAVGAALAGVR